MTKQNFTSINVIIDASGSMQSLTGDTIGSFNSFLKEQKAFPGEAIFTLCTFNNVSRLVHDSVKIDSIPDLNPKTYVPMGGTALLDAMGSTMTSVGTKLAAMPEEERPSKVIFLIITDGHENASKEFTRPEIKAMVEHQKDVYNWEFVFMGANIDAISTGASLGISVQNTMSYDSTSAGTKSLYEGVSRNLSSYRTTGNTNGGFFGQQDVQIIPPVDTIKPKDTK